MSLPASPFNSVFPTLNSQFLFRRRLSFPAAFFSGYFGVGGVFSFPSGCSLVIRFPIAPPSFTRDGALFPPYAEETAGPDFPQVMEGGNFLFFSSSPVTLPRNPSA